MCQPTSMLRHHTHLLGLRMRTGNCNTHPIAASAAGHRPEPASRWPSSHSSRLTNCCWFILPQPAFLSSTDGSSPAASHSALFLQNESPPFPRLQDSHPRRSKVNANLGLLHARATLATEHDVSHKCGLNGPAAT